MPPHAVVVGIVGIAAAMAGVDLRAQDAPGPREVAAACVREFTEPGKQTAAVARLVALGPEALPALHKALVDPRPEVVRWALFACSGLTGDTASLRNPIERHLRSADLGVALAAQRAWPIVDGGGVFVVADDAWIRMTGDERERRKELTNPYRCEPLPNGNLLVVSHERKRIVEYSPTGDEVWAFPGAKTPVDAKRLPNGNTLIADYTARRVIEVDEHGTVVWSVATEGMAFDADRLGNGNTLIAQFDKGGVIEVDPKGQTVWQWKETSVGCVARQPDGNTLVALCQRGVVVLLSPELETLRQWPLEACLCAELLPNGHLVAGSFKELVEFDANGHELWKDDVTHLTHLHVRGPGLGRRSPAAPKAGK